MKFTELRSWQRAWRTLQREERECSIAAAFTQETGRLVLSKMASTYFKISNHIVNQVGEMIPDQIIQSVESSRRTLIVLSKAYVDSMWTKLEFRAAHTQASDLNTRAILQSKSLQIFAHTLIVEYLSIFNPRPCKTRPKE